MEAIIRHSGRQFRVKEGLTLEVDFREAEPGSPVEFGEVLYVGEPGGKGRVGTPTVEGAKVLGKVLGLTRGPKLIAAQFRRRKNSRRRIGHRQTYTRVLIETIQT
ncbi:MAG: 50S ribosomal protein L21 [Planctomycetes bacterium]|nr:50S ribosomal protein L21 [Planctomycetota bacterium]